MLRTRAVAAALTLLPLAAVVAACGATNSPGTGAEPAPSSSSSAAVSGSVTVLAAASLTEAFGTLGKQFEAEYPGTTVTFSFGASSTLAQQITQGAPADVFASASSKNMDQVVQAGDATAPRTFATNVAEVAVSPQSASTITSLNDLTKPGTKVALCQPEVPCGALALTVLGNAGLKVTPVTQGLDVKSVLTSVTTGEVDAGIVYVTDVRSAGDKVRGVQIPASVNASTSYPIATLKGAKNPSAAQAFEAYVLSQEGRDVLLAAGFRGP